MREEPAQQGYSSSPSKIFATIRLNSSAVSYAVSDFDASPIFVVGLFGASTTVVCQVVTKLHAEHAGVHYTTQLTFDQVASTPEWRVKDPNPPLDVRQAMTASFAGLKQLLDKLTNGSWT